MRLKGNPTRLEMADAERQMITASCVFCERTPVRGREFYDRGGWYALLDRVPMAKGHTLLAAKKLGSNCPQLLTYDVLNGVDLALAEVAGALRDHFGLDNVLIASLRGKHPHVHWHLVPLWPGEEKQWRRRTGHQEGHLFQFLGELEVAKGEVADSSVGELQHDVEALRKLTCYSSA